MTSTMEALKAKIDEIMGDQVSPDAEALPVLNPACFGVGHVREYRYLSLLLGYWYRSTHPQKIVRLTPEGVFLSERKLLNSLRRRGLVFHDDLNGTTILNESAILDLLNKTIPSVAGQIRRLSNGH